MLILSALFKMCYTNYYTANLVNEKKSLTDKIIREGGEIE